MEIAVYSTKDFELATLKTAAAAYGLEFRFIPDALSLSSVQLSRICETVVLFAGDDASAPVIQALASQGVKHIAVRAAGYDNVDLKAAHDAGLVVANVPEYSPYAIAEHAVGMMLALNRKLILSNQQVHAYNFSVDNLIGFDLNGKTVGIVGTGRIGSIVARILNGFGCRLLGYDIVETKALEAQFGLEYTTLKTLAAQSDIITIHTCLRPATHYLINESLIEAMKPGVMLINTSRGAVVKTDDVIAALKRGHIGSFGADVYEREKGVFFYDRSAQVPEDPTLKALLQMPNVLITPHQAFATKEALQNIATTTCDNIRHWMKGERSNNEL